MTMHRIAVIIATVALALVAAACARRESGTTSYRDVPVTPQVPQPRPRPVYEYEAAPARAALPGIEQGDRQSQDMDLRSYMTPPEPLEARDLGQGAGGEKLGRPELNRGEDGSPDNPFVRVDAAGGDASTFSVDVDTASYALVRSAVTQERRLPPRDAVRIEELLNSFRYDYPAPARDGDPFAIAVDTAECPWRPEDQLVRVGISSRTLGRERPPANLVFLIDVSGSMADANKLPLLVRSLELLVDQLGERDRIAVVTYAGEAGVALDPTPGDQHRRIKKALERLSAGGSTNGADGIRTAYRLARERLEPGSETRVILATDGDFNVGVSDDDELARLIREEARAGIYLTVLGFGMGNYRDRKLETLADRGNGFYDYVDTEDEAKRLFVERLPSSLVTVAQDVKVQVFFNPAAVAQWRLIGYEDRLLDRRDFNDDRVDAGEVGAGHQVTALYEIVPVGAPRREVDPNPFVEVEPGAPAPRPIPADRSLRVRLRYQPPGGGTSRLIETDVPAVARPAPPSGDTAWAAAVAAFGMTLRDSPYRGSAGFSLAEQLAETGHPRRDEQRREFLELVRAARSLDRDPSSR